MIRGLFESHLPVRDLERSIAFYTDVVGLSLGMKEEGRRIAFCFAGGWGHTMVGLWEKPADAIVQQHIAFEVALDDLTAAIENLNRARVQPLDFFHQVTDVPTVLAWMPAVSIYFKDPDDHLLEFIAKLPGDPQPERGLVPWDEWNAG